VLKTVGIILIVLGIVALIFGGISYTKKEKVFDVGPIHATAEHKKTIPLPPLLGAVSLIGGVILLVVGGRNS